MTPSNLPAPITPSGRILTAARFQQLADVPLEIEWFANLGATRAPGAPTRTRCRTKHVA